LGERRARPKERLGGLARAQFSAVPDRGGRESDLSGGLRHFVGLPPAQARERPLRVDARADGVGMMHE
jgi:hypothetical protein